MSIKHFLRWWYRGPGLIFVAIGVIVAAASIIQRSREKAATEAASHEVQKPMGQMKPSNGADPSQAQKENELSNRQLHPVVNMPEPTTRPATPPPLQLAAPTLISFYTQVSATPTPTPEQKPHQQPLIWLPPNVLVPCQLLLTVESSHFNTPVLGRVTSDIIQKNDDGVSHVIIPEGAQVSAFAQSGATNNKIEVAGVWNVIFPDGRILRVNAIALNCDARPELMQFGIENGAAGLQGEIIESDPYKSFKSLIAILIMSVTQAGTAAVTGAISHGVGAGVGVGLPDTTPVMSEYLKGLLNGETGDGLFVRVVSGTRFWLFPTDSIEPRKRTAISNSQLTAPVQDAQEFLRSGQPQSTPTPGNPSPILSYAR